MKFERTSYNLNVATEFVMQNYFIALLYYYSMDIFLFTFYDDIITLGTYLSKVISYHMYNTIQYYNINSDKVSFHKRMHKYIRESDVDFESPFVVYVRSKALIKLINKRSSYENKLAFLKDYNVQLTKISKKLYKDFEPNLIYAFNNELHLIFNKETSIYKGSSQRLLTNIVSAVTRYFSDLNVQFEGRIIYFPKQCEVLNFLVWRQFDCKRNTLTLLHKCVKPSARNGNRKTEINEGMENILHDLGPLADEVVNGNIYKKEVYYKGDELVTRTRISVLHEWLSENFDSSYQKYILNKVL